MPQLRMHDTEARLQLRSKHERPSNGPTMGLQQTDSTIQSAQVYARGQAFLRDRISAVHGIFTVARDQQGEARSQGDVVRFEEWQESCEVLH